MNLKEFFSNPWVGGIGSIASVAGLFLAVYFYVDGRQSRHLEVNVNPAKATVVKSGQSSKLSVSYDSQPISTDITAAQIEIWNAGNLPIKAENVLQPLVITTEGVAILEASVTKVSRAVTMVALDSSEAQKGRLRVSWGIFERSDGAVIQVTYAGKPDTNITAEGTIEGYGGVRVTSERRLQAPRIAWLLVAALPLFAAALVLMSRGRNRSTSERVLDLCFIAVTLSYPSIVLWDFFHRAPSFMSVP